MSKQSVSKTEKVHTGVKVDWSKVPAWAAGVAMDETTSWWWYYAKPEVITRDHIWDTGAGSTICGILGRDSELHWSNGVPWDQTWTERPAAPRRVHDWIPFSDAEPHTNRTVHIFLANRKHLADMPHACGMGFSGKCKNWDAMVEDDCLWRPQGMRLTECDGWEGYEC